MKKIVALLMMLALLIPAAVPALAGCDHAGTTNTWQEPTGVKFDPIDNEKHLITYTISEITTCTACGDLLSFEDVDEEYEEEAHQFDPETNYCNTCAYTKNAAKPSKVILSESGTVVLPMGEPLALDYKFMPEGAFAAVKWSTSSKKVATVDANGVVTPVKEGTATITIKTANGNKDTVKVKVIDPYKPAKVVLVGESTVTMSLGQVLTLEHELVPATAQTKLTWTSSSKKVATVDQNGVVTPVKEGTATITVKTANGKKDTVKVKIVDPNKVSSIKLDKTGTQKMKVGDTMQISCKIAPATAQTTLTWKSSKTSVATVNDEGLVTAVGKGTATITVTTHNGKKATVKVSVSEAPAPEITNPVGAKELSGYLGKPFSNLKKVVSGLEAEQGGKDGYITKEFYRTSGDMMAFWGFISTGDFKNPDSITGGWKKDCVYALQTKMSGHALHGFYVGMPERDIEAQASKLGYSEVNASGDMYRTYDLSGKKVGDVNYSMMVFAKNGSVYAVRIYALKDGYWCL